MEASSCGCKPRISPSRIRRINYENTSDNEEKRYISIKDLETAQAKLWEFLKFITQGTFIENKMIHFDKFMNIFLKLIILHIY